MLLPASVLLRRADAVTVIGAARLAKAGGAGHRPIAALLGTGICYDNAVAESFFASYKKELIHTRPWPDIKHLRKATFDWVEAYYNRKRRHSTRGYLTNT